MKNYSIIRTPDGFYYLSDWNKKTRSYSNVIGPCKTRHRLLVAVKALEEMGAKL
jgi:hypothetical protein